MKVIKVVLSIATIAVLASCNNQGVTKKSLENEVDSASYALGLDMGSKLRVNFTEANNDLFVQGFRNGVDSTELLIEMLLRKSADPATLKGLLVSPIFGSSFSLLVVSLLLI